LARTSPTQTRVTLAVTAVLIVLGLLALPAQAFAWGNGVGRSGNTFGTHDWILTEANRMAAIQGATWVNASVAIPVTDDPDTKFRDTKDHAYDRWGKANGNAQQKVATYYSQAVAYLHAGDIDSASRSLGLLSHYYADVNNPLDTDNIAAETRMHSRYDTAVDSHLKAVGMNRAWVTYDGYSHVGDPSALTVASARSAHGSYTTLVGQYNRRGYSNSTVRTITSRSINRATNGLADIIVSIQEDAALVSSSPEVHAHQGITTDGSDTSDYWIVHTTWIQRYTSSWESSATASKPFNDEDGTLHEGFTSDAHLGTGAYYRSADATGGKLYVPAENWSPPTFDNQHIFVFDALTLKRERAVATSQTHEVAAITVAPDSDGKDVLYVASYRDSSKLFRYDLETLAYIDSMPLKPVPGSGIQGLTYRDGTFFLSTGLNQDLGRIYTADRSGNTRLIFTSTLAGWHEGIAWRNKLLLWLVDHPYVASKVRFFRLPGF